MGAGRVAPHASETGAAISSGASHNRRRQLSPRTEATLRQIGSRLVEGFSPKEIANEFGTSSSLVLARMAEAQAELCRLSLPG